MLDVTNHCCPKLSVSIDVRTFFALLPIEHMFDRLNFLWKTFTTPFTYPTT
jgi:hypothetical protein